MRQIAVVTTPQPLDEVLQPPGFYVEIPGRADEFRKAWCLDSMKRFPVEEAGLSQVRDGPLNIAPVSVLRQDRSDDDLNRGLAGVRSPADRMFL